MKIESYLESTYLKTKEEVLLSEIDYNKIVVDLVNDAIAYSFRLVMIRANYIALANKMISKNNSRLLVGTVIDFPFGNKSTAKKILEANFAIRHNVSDLDFVADYNSYKRGEYKKFDNDIIEASRVCIKAGKNVKWIIETGALSKDQIFSISQRIYNIVNSNFIDNINKFFIKTSTGYYKNTGANVNDIRLIRSAANKIHIKASGGIKNREDCIRMIEAGATTIGTSSAIEICKKRKNEF